MLQWITKTRPDRFEKAENILFRRFLIKPVQYKNKDEIGYPGRHYRGQITLGGEDG